MVMGTVGHSSLEMTTSIYGHVTLDDKRAPLDHFGDLLTEESE